MVRGAMTDDERAIFEPFLTSRLTLRPLCADALRGSGARPRPPPLDVPCNELNARGVR